MKNIKNKQTSKFSEKRQFGNKGEDVVYNHLKRSNYEIIDRNYLRKWGEIDIVAFKDDIFHFIEVKTVSRDILAKDRLNTFRPEENVHVNKIKRLKRTIQTYIAERGIEDRVWEFSVAVVFLDLKNKMAKMIHLKNLIIE